MEGLLHGVFSVMEGAAHAVAVGVQLAVVRFGEAPKRIMVAALARAIKPSSIC